MLTSAYISFRHCFGHLQAPKHPFKVSFSPFSLCSAHDLQPPQPVRTLGRLLTAGSLGRSLGLARSAALPSSRPFSRFGSLARSVGSGGRQFWLMFTARLSRAGARRSQRRDYRPTSPSAAAPVRPDPALPPTPRPCPGPALFLHRSLPDPEPDPAHRPLPMPESHSARPRIPLCPTLSPGQPDLESRFNRPRFSFCSTTRH